MVLTQQAQPVTAARRRVRGDDLQRVRPVGAVMPARVDVDVDIIEVPDRVQQVSGGRPRPRHGPGARSGPIDDDCDRCRQPVTHPAGLHRTHPLHPADMTGGVLDRLDDVGSTASIRRWNTWRAAPVRSTAKMATEMASPTIASARSNPNQAPPRRPTTPPAT